MRRLSVISWLVAVASAAAGCSSHSGAPPDLDSQSSDATVPVAEQCQAVTSIEVVHRVNGSNVTDRVRLTADAAADAAQALRTFQAVANDFGTDTIVSSRKLTQVFCFSQQPTARRPIIRFDDPPPPPQDLCADPTGRVPCDPLDPSHTYDYGGTETCTVTEASDSSTFSCEDSGAIITSRGDVVLTINTDALRNQIAARTQALRKLVADANVITNIHFDIQINPGQQASIVGNNDFNNIAQQIKQAADSGQPLPDIQQILNDLPEKPLGLDFYLSLMQSYEMMQNRLQTLSDITNGRLLSPQQVNAFYTNFVGATKAIDKLVVDHSDAAMNQATSMVNDKITQLATVDPGSPNYQQIKSGAESVLKAQTTNGVFDPDHTVDVVVPDLSKFLTDADIEKQLAAEEMMIEMNETIRRSDAVPLIEATSGILGLLMAAADNDDKERMWRLYDQVQATTFFFDSDNPTGTSYDVHLSPVAQSLFHIDVQPTSAVNYGVINMLNEVADYNANTGVVTQDIEVVIVINAIGAVSTDDQRRGLYHTEEGYGILSFLKHAAPAFLGGALKELGSTAKGILYTAVDLWSDPQAFLDHMKQALVNWRQTMDIILQQGVDVIHRWPNMTTEEKAELLGRIATQVLLTLPAEARTVSQVDSVLQDAVRLELGKVAHGLEIIERGGIALSEDAAVELVKRLEKYEITTTEDILKVADKLDDALPCSIVSGTFAPIVLSGAKPPCNINQIVGAIADFDVRAGRMGLTTAADLADLLESTEALIPGKVVRNALDLTAEVPFAEKIVAREGGVFVGQRVGNRQAIDGFFKGQPAQLYSPTGTNLNTIFGKFGFTETQAVAPGLSNIALYIECPTIARADIVAYLQVNDLVTRTLTSRVTSVHFLSKDGWFDIINGVLH